MRNAVFSFTKPSPDSTVASNRIATFVSDTLDLPLLCDEAVDSKWDVLFIVNGGFAFCPVRDELGRAVRRAKRVVWIQNDYTIYCPTDNGTAETTFRRAFTKRRELGLPPVDQWTTVLRLASKTPDSAYVNWNSLTSSPKALPISPTVMETLLYYGAYRQGRRAAFDTYFDKPAVETHVSSTSKQFALAYRRVVAVPPLAAFGFRYALNAHGLGLYLEDKRSHHDYHSPANRFYEMLSSGLPMVFEPAAAPLLLQHAAIDVRPYMVTSRKSIRRALGARNEIAHEQAAAWDKPYLSKLTQHVRRLYRAYIAQV